MLATAGGSGSSGTTTVSLGYDASLFVGPQWAPGWKPVYQTEGDVAPVSALEVDEGSYGVEPTEKIRERAEAWARVVGEDRLWLSPSCGFGRHTARDVPVLRQKVENMVEAAASF